MTRLGAWMWVGCRQYFVAEAICVRAWRGDYSLRYDFISDLGAMTCSAVGRNALSPCSPLPLLMNASFVFQGLLLLVGTASVGPSGVKTPLGRIGLALVAASGLGAIAVGLAPENSVPTWRYIGAAENFVTCNLGALITGAALWRKRAEELKAEVSRNPRLRRCRVDSAATAPSEACMSPDSSTARGAAPPAGAVFVGGRRLALRQAARAIAGRAATCYGRARARRATSEGT